MPENLFFLIKKHAGRSGNVLLPALMAKRNIKKVT